MTLCYTKKLPALIRGIISKHHSDFFYLICFHFFSTENKRESDKEVCEIKDFCNVLLASENSKILEFNQYQKSDKASIFIQEGLEYLIEKIDGCKNDSEN